MNKITVRLTEAANCLIELDNDIPERQIEVHGNVVTGTAERLEALAQEYDMRQSGGWDLGDNPGGAVRCARSAARRIRDAIAKAKAREANRP